MPLNGRLLDRPPALQPHLLASWARLPSGPGAEPETGTLAATAQRQHGVWRGPASQVWGPGHLPTF